MSLDVNLKNQLAQYLQLLEKEVVISLSVSNDENSKEVRDFVTEISEMSEKISLEEKALRLTPSFSLSSEVASGIEFAGVPLGHEFESFVLAILQVGGRTPKISENEINRIKAIDKELNFETVVSLSCHNCPDVVQALNIMSVLNPNVKHTMIEGGMHKDLVEKRGVMAVPSVFLNGEEFANGRMTLEQILDKAVGESTQDRFEGVEPFDVLVVGGGAAGGAAAVYAARKGIRTGIVCEEFGGQVKETLGIENIIGISYTEGPKYMEQVRAHVADYNVDIVENAKVEDVVPGDMITVVTNKGELKAKTVIIATGAKWRLIGIPGETELRNKGVAYCTHCDGPLFKGKKVAVIGGGNSGVEAAIDLAGMAKEVLLLEFLPELRADEVLQKRLRSLPNVEIVTNAQTTAIAGTEKVIGIDYTDRISGEKISKDIDGCFIQVGLVPSTEWLGDRVEMNERKEIIVNKEGATNVEGIFAAGDCTDTAFKQIIIAEGSGATAALGAFNYLMRK